MKDTVRHLIRGMGSGARSIRSTYDLLEGGTLAHVERLIEQHRKLASLPSVLLLGSWGAYMDLYSQLEHDVNSPPAVGRFRVAAEIALVSAIEIDPIRAPSLRPKARR